MGCFQNCADLVHHDSARVVGMAYGEWKIIEVEASHTIREDGDAGGGLAMLEEGLSILSLWLNVCL